MEEQSAMRAAARAAILAAADGLEDLTVYEIERAYPQTDVAQRLTRATETLSTLTDNSSVDEIQSVFRAVATDLVEAIKITDSTTRLLDIAFAELAMNALCALAAERGTTVASVIDSLNAT